MFLDARGLSEVLGIEFYDRDIVEATADKIGMPLSKISDEEENASGLYFFMKYPLGKSTTDIQNKIFDVQRRIIIDLADRESCIIVGRCSDFIMADHKNHISIFIYAPYEERACMTMVPVPSPLSRVARGATNFYYTSPALLTPTFCAVNRKLHELHILHYAVHVEIGSFLVDICANSIIKSVSNKDKVHSKDKKSFEWTLHKTGLPSSGVNKSTAAIRAFSHKKCSFPMGDWYYKVRWKNQCGFLTENKRQCIL